MKKIKIIFDNNKSIVGGDKPIAEIFSANVYKLLGFIKKNKIENRVSVCLTEIFKQEGVAELQERAISKYKDAIKCGSILEGIAVGDKLIKEISEKKLIEKIKEQFDLKIKENNIEIIPLTSEMRILDLVDRAINYNPPFEKKDKGFKDSVAWISILEDAKNNQDITYILITVDTIFNRAELKKEFLTINKNSIVITSPEPIEEELDNILVLGIGLEEIGKEATENLNKDISFQRELEKKMLESVNEPIHGFMAYFPSATAVSMSYPNWKKDVVNVFFRSANVNVKNKINQDTFEVEAAVNFGLTYSGSNVVSDDSASSLIYPINVRSFNPSAITLLGEYESSRPKYIEQRFSLSFSKKNGFKILGIE